MPGTLWATIKGNVEIGVPEMTCRTPVVAPVELPVCGTPLIPPCSCTGCSSPHGGMADTYGGVRGEDHNHHRPARRGRSTDGTTRFTSITGDIALRFNGATAADLEHWAKLLREVAEEMEAVAKV